MTLLYILYFGLSSEFACAPLFPVIKTVRQLFPIAEKQDTKRFSPWEKRERRKGTAEKGRQKKDGGKKKRIMNKGKKEKKREGKKNTEFVTSRNWVVRFAILYYTYFSPLRVHLLSRLAYETRRRKLRSALFKIKGWSFKLLETLRSTHYNEVAFEDASNSAIT